MNRGHIRKRGSSWTIQVYVGVDKLGCERRLTKTIKGTEKDAEHALTALLAEADKGLISTDRSTLAEFLERWLQEYAEPNVEPTTYKRYEELVRIHIVPKIGHIRMGKLEALHLQNIYDNVRKTNCPRTALKVHRLLFQALKYAMRWRVVPNNVAALVDPPKVAEPIPFIPAAGDIQRVLAVAEGMYTGTMVYLAVLTGLRQGELLALRWRDIDFENKLLHVRRSAQWLPGKGVTFKTPKTRRGIRVVISDGANRREAAQTSRSAGGSQTRKWAPVEGPRPCLPWPARGAYGTLVGEVQLEAYPPQSPSSGDAIPRSTTCTCHSASHDGSAVQSGLGSARALRDPGYD